MEFRQLHTFIQAAQLKSFSRAAVQLGYSQSAVTVQIRMLEKELGTRLFDRMGKQVVLTPQGQKFLMHANTILYEVNHTRLSMHEDEELKNPLHIGTIESLCAAKFPAIVDEHAPAQDGLRIDMGHFLTTSPPGDTSEKTSPWNFSKSKAPDFQLSSCIPAFMHRLPRYSSVFHSCSTGTWGR